MEYKHVFSEIKMEQQISTINVDIDGVLYDFTAQMASMDGFKYQGRWFEHIQNQNMKLHDYIVVKFDEYAQNGLFLNGKACDGAHELVSMLSLLKSKYNLQLNILGALPYNKPYSNTVRCHKISFLKAKGFWSKFDDIIFVYGSKSKLQYANDTSILIDDYPRTKARFDELNAPMVLYKNPVDTMKELAKFGLTL